MKPEVGGYAASLLELLRTSGPTRDPVWTSDLEYWIAGREVDGTADPSWRTEEGYLRLCAELDVMPYYWYSEFWAAEPAYDRTVEVAIDRQGAVTETMWRTPIGSIWQEERFVRESCSTAHTRFAVSTRSDLDVLRYLVEHRRLVPSVVDGYAARLGKWLSAGGIPSIALPRSPLAAFLYEWAGLMNGSYLINDYPEIVAELFADMERQEQPVIDALCKTAPPLVHFADNLSSDNMAGFYPALMAPGHRRRIDRLHGSGIACAVHLDGTVRALLPMLAEAGFDAVEAVTPAPAGDVEVEEMRTVARSDAVILWGGVPGVLFAPPYTWSDMKRHVETLIESWTGTRYVVGVADQIPPDGDVTFCPRIAEMLRYT